MCLMHAIKSLELSQGVRKALLKARGGRGGGGRVCDQLVHNSRLADSEVAGWCHSGEHDQSFGFRRPRATCSWSSSS